MKLLFALLLVPLLSFSQEDTTIVDFPDVEASFPGGNAKMVQFIHSNLTYPDSLSLDMEPPGKIYFSFVVEKDGSITHLKNERPHTPEFDKCFEDLMHKMPKWNPAEVNGEAVRSRCRLPIIIHLE